MYKMKTIFVILLFAVFSVKCYADNSENVVDTTKYIFILDDKVITAKYMFDHWNEIEWVTTADTVREAVFTTAGEYRTPFTCFALVKRREETNERIIILTMLLFPLSWYVHKENTI